MEQIQEIFLYETLIPKKSSIIEYYGYTYCIRKNNIYLGGPG